MGTKPQYIYVIYFIQFDVTINLYRMSLARKNVDQMAVETTFRSIFKRGPQSVGAGAAMLF